MKNYLKTDHLIEEKNYIHDNIPIIRFKLRDSKDRIPTIILYHGWSSNKESQRLRGFILANLGFQVIIPDAINHGERQGIENYDAENAIRHFWPTILNNIEEAKIIIDHSIDIYGGDPNRIGVIGHSMGGFTAAGVLTHNKEVKTAVVQNGSFNWKQSNDILKKAMGLEVSHDFKEEEGEISLIDPMNNLDLIIDRPILLLHGSEDNVVSIASQKSFYEKIKPSYNNQSLIQLIEFNNLGHFVTTNMMEEAAIWFKKHL